MKNGRLHQKSPVFFVWRDESNLMQRYDMVVLFGDLFIVWFELFSAVLVLCGKFNRDV